LRIALRLAVRRRDALFQDNRFSSVRVQQLPEPVPHCVQESAVRCILRARGLPAPVPWELDQVCHLPDQRVRAAAQVRLRADRVSVTFLGG
jgi:hypothetical protein